MRACVSETKVRGKPRIKLFLDEYLLRSNEQVFHFLFLSCSVSQTQKMWLFADVHVLRAHASSLKFALLKMKKMVHFENSAHFCSKIRTTRTDLHQSALHILNFIKLSVAQNFDMLETLRICFVSLCNGLLQTKTNSSLSQAVQCSCSNYWMFHQKIDAVNLTPWKFTGWCHLR